MTELTWMKVHSGLLSGKHRARMGVRLWLFLYFIDEADWSTGRVESYTDEAATEWLNRDLPEDEKEITQRTVAEWRRQLQDEGYITCEQGFQCQHIVIHRWRDPRKVVPTQMNTTRLQNNVTHGYVKDGTHPTSKDVTLTYRSHDTHLDTDSFSSSWIAIWETVTGYPFGYMDSIPAMDARWLDDSTLLKDCIEYCESNKDNRRLKPGYVIATFDGRKADAKADAVKEQAAQVDASAMLGEVR